MATPEQIRAAFNHAYDLNDQFYPTLAAVLSNWGAVCNASMSAIPTGTAQDFSTIGRLVESGNAGFYALTDASIYLGQELKSKAALF